MTALGQHVPPDIHLGDSPYSKLLDSRWAEVSLAHLKDQEEYLTRRKNIGKTTSKAGDDTDNAAGDGKRRAKAKTKQKAASSSEKQDA